MCQRQRYLASAAVGGDLGLVAVAHGQQHVLGEVEVAALLAVVFEDVGLDDGVHRAALFAEAAEDALGQVDVVARGAAVPSSRSSDSMVIAIAGHTASHSLQAMQRSSPFG